MHKWGCEQHARSGFGTFPAAKHTPWTDRHTFANVLNLKKKKKGKKIAGAPWELDQNYLIDKLSESLSQISAIRLSQQFFVCVF